MLPRLPKYVCLTLLAASGCLEQDAQTVLVPSDPFGHSPAMVGKIQTAFKEPTLETAARVDRVGAQIVYATPHMGVRPVFRTIGVPESEVFHQGVNEVDITQGLAEQCGTDGQLAAILCMELAKMVADRAVTAAPAGRATELRPPMEVSVGNDHAGINGPVDRTRMAELGKFEEERRRQAAANAPDPRTLARDYLTRAGFRADDLEAADPLLRAAAENNRFAKQMLSVPSR